MTKKTSSNNHHKCPCCGLNVTRASFGVGFCVDPYDMLYDPKDKLLSEGISNFTEKADQFILKHFANVNEKLGNYLFYPSPVNEDGSSDDKYGKWKRVKFTRENPDNFSASIQYIHDMSYKDDVEDELYECYPACSKCAYILPKDFFKYKKVFTIGLAGAPRSGKSVYLQVISWLNCKYISESYGNNHYKFMLVSEPDLGYEMFREGEISLSNDFLPSKTPEGNRLPLLIKMVNTITKDQYLIAIKDIAGEDAVNNRRLPYLSSCNGCILMISIDDIKLIIDQNPSEESTDEINIGIGAQTETFPDQTQKAEFDNDNLTKNRDYNLKVINNVYNRCNKNNANPFIAVTLTKADKPDCKIPNFKLEDSPHNYDGTVIERNSELIKSFLDDNRYFFNFNNPVQYMAVSATGSNNMDIKRDDKGAIISTRVIGGIKPKNIEDPLLWIISSLLSKERVEDENG